MDLARPRWRAPAVRAGRKRTRHAPAAQTIPAVGVVHHLSHSSRLLAPLERVASAGRGQSDGLPGWATLEELQAGARRG